MKKQLVNVINIRHKAASKSKTANKNIFIIKYKDDKDGKIKKKFEVEEEVKYSFYITKDELYPMTAHHNYVPKESVEKVTVNYDNIYMEIAKLLDSKNGDTSKSEYIETLFKNGKYELLEKIHRDFNLHLSDLDIVDYKIREWYEKNEKDVDTFPIDKLFFDIEVDTYKYNGFPHPDNAPCPINFISFLYEPTKTIYSYILINPKNKSQQDWFNMVDDKYIDDIHKEHFPKCNDLIVEIFETELELITAFFDIIHDKKPDFVLAWNSVFDLKTIETRLRDRIEVDPLEIMCPKEFPYKKIDIKEDTFHTDFNKKNSRFDISGYAIYADLLYYYAALRTAKGKMESYTLQHICNEELGEGKFEYEGDISTAAYVNFEKFWLYSLYDSYRLWELETKNNDVDLMQMISIMTYTRINKVMQKTTSLRNFSSKILYDVGFIMSNNRNKFIDHGPKVKFKGALVIDPNKISKTVGLKYDNTNHFRYIFEYIIDMDLSSLYPSIILSGNFDSDTMIGKLYTIAEESDIDNPGSIEVNDVVYNELPIEIIDRIFEGNINTIGNHLLGLPTIDDIIRQLE